MKLLVAKIWVSFAYPTIIIVIYIIVIVIIIYIIIIVSFTMLLAGLVEIVEQSLVHWCK